MEYRDQGSYGAGFALGFILGLVGLIIAIAIDKPETRRGAVTGFIVSLVIGIVAAVCIICVGLEGLSSLACIA